MRPSHRETGSYKQLKVKLIQYHHHHLTQCIPLIEKLWQGLGGKNGGNSYPIKESAANCLKKYFFSLNFKKLKIRSAHIKSFDREVVIIKNLSIRCTYANDCVSQAIQPMYRRYFIVRLSHTRMCHTLLYETVSLWDTPHIFS